MRWTQGLRRRTQLERTAKSCGPDVAVLASMHMEATASWGATEAKEPFSGEHDISRKAIAQGRPDALRCPVCSCALCFVQSARETAGAARTRSSLRPLFSGAR